MDGLDEHSLIEALQCLDLLPSAQIEAESALKRVHRLIESTKEEIRNPKERPIEWKGERKGPRRETDESIISHRAFERLRGRCDAAVAIGKIQELVKTTEDDIAEDDAAPRRLEVRTKLEFIAAHGEGFADVIGSAYVLDALELEMALGKISDAVELQSLSHHLRQIAVLAKQAMDRRTPLITKKRLAYGDPYLKDVGGSRTAFSIDRLPLMQLFIMRCLAAFGQYRLGIASASADKPFAIFAGAIWFLSTGEQRALTNVITVTLKNIRSGNVSPALLAAYMGVPDGTLPPRKRGG